MAIGSEYFENSINDHLAGVGVLPGHHTGWLIDGISLPHMLFVYHVFHFVEAYSLTIQRCTVNGYFFFVEPFSS